MPDREIRRHTEPEPGLSHRGPRREDHEVAGLEAGREEVELLVARRDAGDLGPHLHELRDPLEAVLEQCLDVREVTRLAPLPELEDHLLRAVDEVGDVPRPLLPEPRDLLSRPDEPAERCHLLDDARVVLDVRRGGDERCELGHPRRAADGLELAAGVELVRERDRVDGLALRPQRERGPVDRRVALAVEIGRVEDLGDIADRGRRQQHRAENGLLRLEVLGRDMRGEPTGACRELCPRRPRACHPRGSQAAVVRNVQSAAADVERALVQG